MNAFWWGTLGTSAIAFALKYFGHSLPEKYLNNPRMLRVNLLIPIALLSALVAVNTFAEKTKLTLDHRATGLLVAVIALRLRAPYFVVVVGAAVTSAIIYRMN